MHHNLSVFLCLTKPISLGLHSHLEMQNPHMAHFLRIVGKSEGCFRTRAGALRFEKSVLEPPSLELPLLKEEKPPSWKGKRQDEEKIQECSSQVMLVVKRNLPANAGDTSDAGLIPRLGRCPWSWKWHPTPIFFPGKFHGLYRPRESQRVGHD